MISRCKGSVIGDIVKDCLNCKIKSKFTFHEVVL